jgi:hypothetical protein
MSVAFVFVVMLKGESTGIRHSLEVVQMIGVSALKAICAVGILSW